MNNPQNSEFFPQNLGKVPQNPREVSSKSKEVLPENLGKSYSKSWESPENPMGGISESYGSAGL